MKQSKYSFLLAVLGEHGAGALQKALERSSDLEAAVLPRAIVSWLEVAASSSYSGSVPGVENTYLAFQKSESGFSGDITIGEDVYAFKDASTVHLAAAIAVSLGLDQERVAPSVRNIDLAKLGKNLDLLVKAREVARLMKAQGLKKCCSGPFDKEGRCKHDLDKAKGAEPQGTAAKPIAPVQPEGPQGPQMGGIAQQKKPAGGASSGSSRGLPSVKPKMSKSVKITKAQAAKKCTVCRGVQFSGSLFVGCLCFQDLAKSVKVQAKDGKFELSFGEDWDRDSILTLIESFGG